MIFDRLISPKEAFKVEEAITFLVDTYSISGYNPKPVILHSLRVALYLLECGYEKDVVIVGVLHDLLEDTKVTEEEIEQRFGLKILTWIKALTNDSTITDSVRRYEDLFARTIAGGRECVVIKAADLLLNSIYVKMVPDIVGQQNLIEKERYFLDLVSAFGNEPAVQGLVERYQQEKARLASTT
jgi:guanosine-3',5'-bis(diphosphate) 3'-pyrophosphohydrolase